MEIEFLTRDGCAGSEVMHDNLSAAVASLGFQVHVVTLDVGELPADDYRTGFGTPTVLVAGEDLLGLPRPEPASPT